MPWSRNASNAAAARACDCWLTILRHASRRVSCDLTTANPPRGWCSTLSSPPICQVHPRTVPARDDRHRDARPGGLRMSARTSPRTVVRLADVTRADRDRVGSKAANLGDLVRAGFPVPEGVVVLGDGDPDPSEILQVLGDGPFAVRSSAVAEDLPDASFAGQYETVLNVRGPDALREAIRHVRASAVSARAQHYAAARGLSGSGGIAVLVQRMLAPEAAGVAFTADPVTGRRDEVVITTARGLGERVVSGEAVGAG